MVTLLVVAAKRERDKGAMRAWAAAYRKRHPERVRQSSKASYEKRKVERAAYAREWYQRNKERVRLVTAEWRKRNPEWVRDRNARAAKTCVDARRAATLRRRARLAGAPGRGVTAADIAALRAESMGLCAYCGLAAVVLQVDHIEPVSGGGSHDPDNLAVACRSCNASKGPRGLLVWMASRVSSRRAVA